MVQLNWGLKSITGNFRENNEDSCTVHGAGRMFIVADGMGGQNAGEKASAMAVELFPKRLEQKLSQASPVTGDVILKSIDEAVSHANTEIMALGEVDSDTRSMGTTIAFIVHYGETLYVGGVGDSRVYMLRNGNFMQLTTDHSLTQALIDAGTLTPEEAVGHRYRNVLYRYLGTKEGGTGVQTRQIQPQAGDRFLICSDGVLDGSNDDDLADILRQYDDPQEAADVIVDGALSGGSKDNITCIVVHCG
ncbi:MAG: protein phosphatase 2C domain-containing protein [Planctomycetaceae bacterium]|jgi:protein phosphatase